MFEFNCLITNSNSHSRQSNLYHGKEQLKVLMKLDRKIEKMVDGCGVAVFNCKIRFVLFIYLLTSNFFSSVASFLDFISAKNPRIAKNPITQISVIPIFNKVPFPGY